MPGKLYTFLSSSVWESLGKPYERMMPPIQFSALLAMGDKLPPSPPIYLIGKKEVG